MKLKYCIYFIIFIFFSNLGFAENNFKPYFATIKSSEVNVRIGPNIRYPIKWVFVKKYEPVEIIASFEQWYKIREIDGEEGWIRASMISNKRSLIIKGSANIDLLKNYDSNKIIAKLQPGLRVDLEKCNKTHCLIKTNNIKGWVDRKSLWGIYISEFNE